MKRTFIDAGVLIVAARGDSQMDKVTAYREAITKILSDWAEIDRRCPEPGVETCCIFDETHDHYLWMSLGWRGTHRVRSTMIHVRIKDSKI